METITEFPADKKKAIDAILDLLIMAYIYGVNDVNASIGKDLPADKDKMYISVYKVIDGKTWEERIQDYGTIEELKTLADTESHRIFSEGQWDCATEGGAKYKTWLTMQDDRVRESHWYLDGLTVELNDYFYTLSGERALHPGGFGVPSEDVNCRCYLEYSM